MSRAFQRQPERGGLARCGSAVVTAAGALSVLGIVWGIGVAQAAPTLPEIRTSTANAVPSCVTPQRLMSFLKRRNGNLNPRFRDIAAYYKSHGETWHVRWDYAFFQMALETNFLTYRAPSGRMGDVDPKQNNFAGIGTTGGGVPGDSFPDVSTGVLGQIQHLVVYSGEQVASPVAPRTRLKQEHILAKSRELNRPVRFSDLARRWAADPKYASSIAWVAGQFAREECKGRQEAAPQEGEVLPWQQTKADAPVARAGAMADAGKDGAAVRTIWRRDDAKQGSAPKVVAPVKAEPKVAAKPAVEAAAPKLKPAAPKPVATEVILSATAEPPPSEAPPFALFSPPAALADAKIVQPKLSAAAATPAPAAQQTSAPEVQVAMGPPVPPQGAMVAPLAVTGQQQAQAAPDKSNFPPPSGLGVKPGRCVVETATFGGATTVLVKAPVDEEVHYIALSVIDGFEAPMTQSFLASRPGGGEAIGTFPNKDEALAKARALCPE